MTDYTKDDGSRPNISPLDAVNFCIKQIFGDRRRAASDIVAGKCSYEELMGALLLTQDELNN